MYALGITLYCLLNNDLYPLITAYSKDDKDAAELSNARRIKGERIPAPANGSSKLQEIVLKAIEYLPENRYKTAEEFKNALINYDKDTASATKTEALPVTPKREDSEINNNLINIAAPHAQSQTDNDPIVIAPEKSRPDANVQIMNESVQNNMSSQISYPQPSYRYPTHSQQVPSGKTNNDLTKYAIIGAIIVIIAIIIASNSNTSNNGDSYIDSSIGASSTFDEYSDDSSESSEDSEDASTDYDTSNIIPVKKTSCSGSAGKGKYGRKYGSDMAVDGKPETCWMAYGTPAGKGSWIRLDFAKTTTIKGIEFINGNTWNGVYKGKFIEGYEELYEKNGRLHDFTLEFSDGTQLSGSADDIKETEYEENIFVFNSPIKTRYVIIYVESGYKGYKYENNVCIGEISVFC